MRLCMLTVACIVIFAMNSILCRAAIIIYGMGAMQYAAVRVLSAAVMLAALIIKPKRISHALRESSWAEAGLLFTYMLAFALSYADMPAAAGTLILNSAVQFSMIGWGISHGILPSLGQFSGILLALAGLVILVFPGLSAPPLINSFFMLVSGLAWGAYSIFGLKNKSAFMSTAGNFIRAIPFGLCILLFSFFWENSTGLGGFACAATSGAIASALGYTLWYAIVPHLNLMGSSAVQLAIPPVTAILGFIFLHELIGVRLLLASVPILGGIALVLCRTKISKKDN